MPGYRTPEYLHLILAERAIAGALGDKPEHRDIAQLASALVRVIDQKRVMRGMPAPKPESGIRKGVRRNNNGAQLDTPSDPTA